MTGSAPPPKDPAPEDPAAEEHARRLYRRAIAWGLFTLAFLWWWSRHWKA